MRRYAGRLFTGVLLGVLFGLSNGLILNTADMLIKRLSDPSKAAVTAPAIVSKGFFKSLSDSVARGRQAFQDVLDPWLPLKGRPMDRQQMVGILFLFPVLMALRGYLGFLSDYCLGWVSERAVNDLQVDILQKLQSLSIDFFNRSQLGDLTTRIHGDTFNLQRSLNFGLADAIKEPVTVVAVFTVLLFRDPGMMLFLLLVMPLLVTPIILLGRKVRAAAKRAVQTKVSQASLLIEALSGIRVVKAFGLEDQQLGRFRDYAKELVRHGVKGIQAKGLINPTIETVTALILGILIVFLFRSGRDWDDMMVFIAGLVSVYTPMKRLAGLHVLFQQTTPGVDRLVQLLNEQPSVKEPVQPKPLPRFERGLGFENVSFAYREKPILNRVTFTIPRGQKLGLAGESGSGKSTLLNLLFRFYDPTDGKITLDGVDLRDLSTQTLRAHCALVSQEIVLFDQTVAENIGCGRLGATRADIEAAARSAFAHDFIQQLPQGYDTRVGERGITLSQGQRQRVAIARAFVRNAPILVLDEATASLDSQSEAEVQSAIDALAEQRTVICVAHRLSTLSNMDRVLVLDQGRIVEDGSFQELLRAGKLFAKMAQKQGIFPS